MHVGACQITYWPLILEKEIVQDETLQYTLKSFEILMIFVSKVNSILVLENGRLTFIVLN